MGAQEPGRPRPHLLARLRQQYVTPATIIRLVPISVVLVSGIVLTTWTDDLLSRHRDMVVHTHEVIENAKDVLIGLDDAETGQRGYLLSGEERYLQPYEKARMRLVTMTATLRAQLADNASQLAHFDRLSVLMGSKLEELEADISARRKEGFGAALALMLSGTDRATMDAIRYQIGQITHGEQALLSARDAEVQVDENRAQIVAVLIGAASLLTRVAAEFYLTRKARLAAIAGDGQHAAIQSG